MVGLTMVDHIHRRVDYCNYDYGLTAVEKGRNASQLDCLYLRPRNKASAYSLWHAGMAVKRGACASHMHTHIEVVN